MNVQTSHPAPAQLTYETFPRLAVSPEPDQPFPNLTACIFNQVVAGQRIPETKLRKIAKISAYGCGTAISFVSLIPAITAAFAYDKDHRSQSKAILAWLAVIGVCLDFGTLGAWGYKQITDELFKQIPEEERQIQAKPLPTSARLSMVGLSLLLGLLSRLPSAGVAIKFRKGVAWAAVSMAGEAGPPSYSMYCSLNSLARMLRSLECCSSDRRESSLRIIQHELCVSIDAAIQSNLRMCLTERKRRFTFFYLEQAQGMNPRRAQRVQALFQNILEVQSDWTAIQPRCRCIVQTPRETVKLLMTVLPLCLIIQNALLSMSASEHFSHNPVLRDLVGVFGGMAMAWVAIALSRSTSEKLYNQFLGLLGVPYQKSFEEIYYPKITAFLELLTLGIALLPYGELASIAEQYISAETWYGKLFIAGNVITLNLLIFNSLQTFIEMGIKAHARSGYGQENARHALAILDRLEQLKDLVQQSSLPDLARMLDYIDDPDLKLAIINNAMDLNDMKAYLRQMAPSNEAMRLLADARPVV